ncbi:YlbF family regulator [Schnuerera sp.]|uniref:YlbF family regulator n=1 Tax=Schnuerera sp. TaxID=2794844 RepID=UPI002B55E6B2|nr:YlbF family regulator [Schnuerera sp.]HSH36869.1 YlbF family regulator [Schnuerera sp.]
MNNVYDQAHKLARAIRASEEYKTYVGKRKAVYSDEKNKKMVEDFKNKVLQIQMEQMSGKEVEQEELEKISKLEEVLTLNPTINDFLNAELRFSQLVQDINKIIGDAIELENN